MAHPIEICPNCGAPDLVAVCNVVVEYAILNDGYGGQDWERSEIDDDTSNPTHFCCNSCEKEFHEFELDEYGYLVSWGGTG